MSQPEEDPYSFLPVIEVHTPLNRSEEFANALTHGAAAFVGIIGTFIMIRAASEQSMMTIICCAVSVLSAVAVFIASALSHYWIDNPRLLQRSRAWDQGLIYVMIAGTYTPMIWRYADDSTRTALLGCLWLAALGGFYSKVLIEHRVNKTGVISYLLLGWLPSLGLVGKVPSGLLLWMFIGGITYVLGIVFLLNDRRFRYMHVAWHLCVVIAAGFHYVGVYSYVALNS